MKIFTKQELEDAMPSIYETKRNTWHKSNIIKGYYFWNHEEKEYETMFPVFYSTLKNLKSVSQKLYGTPGFLIRNRKYSPAS